MTIYYLKQDCKERPDLLPGLLQAGPGHLQGRESSRGAVQEEHVQGKYQTESNNNLPLFRKWFLHSI